MQGICPKSSIAHNSHKLKKQYIKLLHIIYYTKYTSVSCEFFQFNINSTGETLWYQLNKPTEQYKQNIIDRLYKHLLGDTPNIRID